MLLSTNTLLAKVSRQIAFVALLGLPLLSEAQTITSFTPNSGPVGTSVLITGTGLTNVKSVLLNGQALKITNASLGTVTVTIPVAASTGKLVLTVGTTTGGTSATVSGSQFGVTRSTSGLTFSQQTTKGASFSNIKVATSASGFYSTPVVADLTGKGRADLLIGNGNGNIEYWQQNTLNGDTYTKVGNLKLTSNTGTDIKVTNFAKPTVADIDGDGLLDLLVGTGTSRRIARFEQTAANATSFNQVANLQAAGADLQTGDNYPRPTIADLDGNGKLDLLVGDLSGVIKRYEASTLNGTTFTALGNVQVDGADLKVDGTSKPLLFDLDGNGLLDFIVGSQAGAVTRYEQTARYAATFTSRGNLLAAGATPVNMGTAGNNEGGYAAPTITDLDGDGRLDLLVGNANGTIYRFEQAQQAALAVSPLPVKLTSFGTQNASAGALLNWATASELNSASFEVQRSLDGASFATVGSVAAAGTSATPRSYQYLDAAAPAGTSYYRLRQVDLDGTVAYSPVVVLARPAAGSAAAKPLAFPVPFTDALSVALPGADAPQAATVALLTLDGRTVYSRTLALSAAPQALDGLPTLAPGIYVLRTTTAAGSTTQRISRN